MPHDLVHHIAPAPRQAFSGSADVTIRSQPSLPPVSELAQSLAIIIDQPNAEELCCALRSSRETCLIPLAVLPKPGLTPKTLSLVDVVTESLDEVLEVSRQIRERLSGLPVTANMATQDLRLLTFLASRGRAPLSVVLAPDQARLYAHPLAACLADPDEDVPVWLDNLVRRGLLARHTLVDRVRTCPRCSSSRFNFVDVSPDDNSLNIMKVPFLHCFVCGHVAPQANFTRQGTLECPNCLTRLRHIGTDYDRPAESWVNEDTGAYFVEPKVVARCLDCTAVLNPEELGVRQIVNLSLTDRGEVSAKAGALDDLYDLLDNLNYVVPAYFNQLLDWLIMLTRRYPTDAFTIIGLRMDNILELTNSLGHEATSILLDTFCGRLKELLRTTDVTTRTGRRLFWLLLPKTPEAGRKIILGRIMALAEYTRQPSGEQLNYSSVAVTIPDDIKDKEDASLLLARLTTMIEDA